MQRADEAQTQDHTLTPIPATERQPLAAVAVQRLGQVTSLSKMVLCATIGYHTDLATAFGALLLATAVLTGTSWLLGYIGVREGLSVTVLIRRFGLGSRGSSILSLVLTVCTVGWFGIQNGMLGRGLHLLIGGPPEWLWNVLGGLLVTTLVVVGFRAMTWTAWVLTPAFLALVLFVVLRRTESLDVLSAKAVGPVMPFATATSLIIGAYVVGVLISPDISRFSRNTKEMTAQTVLGIVLGELLTGSLGFLAAKAAQSGDMISAVIVGVGVVGALVLVAAVVQINDWNLYSSALSGVNLIDGWTGKRLPRSTVTWALGALGTVGSALGLFSYFTDFLQLLNAIAAPVIGVMIAAYFFGPNTADRAWSPRGFLAWGAGIVVSLLLPFGLVAVTAIVVSMVVYCVLRKVP